MATSPDHDSNPTYERPDQLFASTAPDYIAHRPSHPADLVRLLAETVLALPGYQAGAPVLDLGSGPGTLALDLAERGVIVKAADASPEMLAAGKRWATRRAIANVTWTRADAHDPVAMAALGPAAAVTIGDAFHWMNRRHVLGLLDGLVSPTGLVAVLGSHAPGTPRAWWEPLLTQLRMRHLGDDRLAGPGTQYVEPLGGHEDILRRSAFSQLTVIRADYRRSLTIDQLVGLQMTFAYSSPAVLGDRREAFENDIRTVLQTAQPTGPYVADLQAALIIARRPVDPSL